MAKIASWGKIFFKTYLLLPDNYWKSLFRMIEHEGTVVAVSDKKTSVKIMNTSACVSCQLNGKCNLSDVKEKIIDIALPNKKYNIGDKVVVTAAESVGFKALLFGYILPFLLTLSVIVTLTLLGKSELITGISAIGILVPYFISLALFKTKIQKHFSFYLKNR